MVAVRTAKEQIGFMPHRVEVQRLTPVRNKFGEDEEAWETIVTCWALVRPLRGKEFWSAQKINSTLSHKVTLRATEAMGIRPGQQLLFRDRPLLIKTVQDVESARHQIELMCAEFVER